MTMITPSYLGDTIEYSSYASSLVPSSDPLVTAASVLEFALDQKIRNSRRIQIFNTRVNVKRRFYKTHVNNIAAVRTQSKRSKDG